jgi:hypothetical protein
VGGGCDCASYPSLACIALGLKVNPCHAGTTYSRCSSCVARGIWAVGRVSRVGCFRWCVLYALASRSRCGHASSEMRDVGVHTEYMHMCMYMYVTCAHVRSCMKYEKPAEHVVLHMTGTGTRYATVHTRFKSRKRNPHKTHRPVQSETPCRRCVTTHHRLTSAAIFYPTHNTHRKSTRLSGHAPVSTAAAWCAAAVVPVIAVSASEIRSLNGMVSRLDRFEKSPARKDGARRFAP